MGMGKLPLPLPRPISLRGTSRAVVPLDSAVVLLSTTAQDIGSTAQGDIGTEIPANQKKAYARVLFGKEVGDNKSLRNQQKNILITPIIIKTSRSERP